MSVRNHIGCTSEEFALWRRKMGWTQAEAAAELRTTKRSVQRYESGHQAIPMDTWRSCKLLYLVTEEFARSMQNRPRHELLLWLQQYAQRETDPESQRPAHSFLTQ